MHSENPENEIKNNWTHGKHTLHLQMAPAFVFKNLQKLSMKAFASAQTQPTLQRPITAGR